MPTDKEARQQIVQIVNELFQTGHLTATGGNVSALSGDGELENTAEQYLPVARTEAAIYRSAKEGRWVSLEESD